MKHQPPEFASKVLDALSSHIAVLDADGVIIGVNDAWRRFCERNGGVSSHYVGEDYLALCDRAAGAGDASIASVCQALRAILAGEQQHYSQEYPCHSPGEERWFVLHITRCCKGEGLVHVVVAHEDITERKKAEMALALAEKALAEAKRALERANAELLGALSRAEGAARTDELTRISNRRHFLDMATRLAEIAGRYDQPLSLVLFDVDRFKAINDLHGHPVGDQVLVHVAQILRLQLRAADVLARYGGEEFVALLPESTLDEATAFAERARAAVQASALVVGGHTIPVSVSAGVATMGSQVDVIEKLVQSADKVLYEAKAAGRNQVRASPPAMSQVDMQGGPSASAANRA